MEAKSFIIEERRTDKNGCHLLFDAAIAEQNFALVNLQSANTEKDQSNTINKFSEMLKSVNNISAKQIILGVDFNLYFNSLLKNKGGNPILKNYMHYQND